jgi:hypothetical protein
VPRSASTANGASPAESLRSTLARGAVGAVVGGAALGVANRLANRGSRHKMLGARVPAELDPRRLDAFKLVKGLDAKRLASHVDVSRLRKDVDVKNVLRRIGNLAEQVEARSEDVRDLSAQAKRLTRRIG